MRATQAHDGGARLLSRSPMVAYQHAYTPLWRARNATVFFGGKTYGAGDAYLARRALCHCHWSVSNIVYSTSGDIYDVDNIRKSRASTVPQKSCYPPRFQRCPCSVWSRTACPRGADELMSNGCLAHRDQMRTADAARRLAKSKFNLAWPGDHGRAAVSSRIYDGIAAGSINVFLGSGILDSTVAFFRHLPWHNMSVVLTEAEWGANATQGVEAAIERAKADTAWLARALKLIERHAPDVLWWHPQSRVAENVLRACAANRAVARRSAKRAREIYHYKLKYPWPKIVQDLW